MKIADTSFNFEQVNAGWVLLLLTLFLLLFFTTSIISEILIVNFTSNPYELQLTPSGILEGLFAFHISAVVTNLNGTVFPDKDPAYMFVKNSEYFNLDNVTGNLYFAEVGINFSI